MYTKNKFSETAYSLEHSCKCTTKIYITKAKAEVGGTQKQFQCSGSKKTPETSTVYSNVL